MLPSPPAENEEADDPQQGPEDEGEERRPQPLRRQRRQTQGRRENIHHLREGDSLLSERWPVNRDACRLRQRSPPAGATPDDNVKPLCKPGVGWGDELGGGVKGWVEKQKMWIFFL